MSTFPVRWTAPHFKKSQGDTLREAEAAKTKDTRALSKLYAKCYKRDGYKCVVCGRSVEPGSVDPFKKAHPHHIVLRSKATTAEKHTSANITTTCVKCHADVHDKKLLITGNADVSLQIRRVA